MARSPPRRSPLNDGGFAFELSGTNHQTLTKLATFTNATGYYAYGGLTADPAGNLYGINHSGGNSNNGSVYELSGANHQTLTTLALLGDASGNHSYSKLLYAPDGNLYATAYLGGTTGGGTVFELSGPTHQTLTTLVNFPSASANPDSGLIADSAGNFYGTFNLGGSGGNLAVFKLSGPTHQTMTVLATLSSGNGGGPGDVLTIDAAGDLFGTTGGGGTAVDGTVFELSGPTQTTLTILHTFSGPDRAAPLGGVILDAAGDLFGTTAIGGTNNFGTVFELSGPGDQTITTLTSFANNLGRSYGSLVADPAGDLFGTTTLGSSVFELTNNGFVVPEPAGLSLATVAAVMILPRKNRCFGMKPR